MQFYKKPYNPVLGEFHEAHIDSPKYGRTRLVLEQVSHHPPVSAAHIYNEDQKLELFGNASFAVKFGANSVTVTIDAMFEVFAGKFGEKYVTKNGMPSLSGKRAYIYMVCMHNTCDNIHHKIYTHARMCLYSLSIATPSSTLAHPPC